MAEAVNLDTDIVSFSPENIARMETIRAGLETNDTLQQNLNRQTRDIDAYDADHKPIEVDGLPTLIVERGGEGNCFFYSLWSALAGNDLLPYFISRLDPNDTDSKIVYSKHLRQLVARPTRRKLNEFKSTLADKYIDISDFDVIREEDVKQFLNTTLEHYNPPADIVEYIRQADEQAAGQAVVQTAQFNPTRNTFNTMLRNYLADYQVYIELYSSFYTNLHSLWPPNAMPVEELQIAFETILFLIGELPHAIQEFIIAAIQTKRHETLFTLDEFIEVVKNNIKTNGSYIAHLEIEAIKTLITRINEGTPVSIVLDILSHDTVLERLPERIGNTYYIYVYKLDVAHYQEVFLINDIDVIQIVRDEQVWISFEDWTTKRARFQRNRTRRHKQLENIPTQGLFLATLAYEDQKKINDTRKLNRPRNIGNPYYTISQLNKKEFERLDLTSESTEYDKALPFGSPLYSDLRRGLTQDSITKYRPDTNLIRVWTQCARDASKYNTDWMQPDVKPANAEPDWNINPSIRYYWWKEIRLTYEKEKNKVKQPVQLDKFGLHVPEPLTYRYMHPLEFINNERYFFGLGPVDGKTDQEVLEKAQKLVDPTYKWQADIIL